MVETSFSVYVRFLTAIVFRLLLGVDFQSQLSSAIHDSSIKRFVQKSTKPTQPNPFLNILLLLSSTNMGSIEYTTEIQLKTIRIKYE